MTNMTACATCNMLKGAYQGAGTVLSGGQRLIVTVAADAPGGRHGRKTTRVEWVEEWVEWVGIPMIALNASS